MLVRDHLQFPGSEWLCVAMTMECRTGVGFFLCEAFEVIYVCFNFGSAASHFQMRCLVARDLLSWLEIISDSFDQHGTL